VFVVPLCWRDTTLLRLLNMKKTTLKGKIPTEVMIIIRIFIEHKVIPRTFPIAVVKL